MPKNSFEKVKYVDHIFLFQCNFINLVTCWPTARLGTGTETLVVLIDSGYLVYLYSVIGKIMFNTGCQSLQN